jgi:dTDP-4-amino-4,6-dideoxygalactose transaminase
MSGTSITVPFFSPDPFVADHDALLKIIYDLGTGPDQKLILGDRTAELERRLRRTTGAGDVVACGSGTGALTLALRALGVGAGDEVIVPAFCFPAVASTVAGLGGVPVFADVDPLTMTLDPNAAESAVTERTKAVMPAHLFTAMAAMPALTALARRHGLTIVEDAAVAQGAVLDGTPAGRWGDIGVFSFFPIKPFGGAGEGGVALTDEPELGRAMRMLRNHGQDGVHRFLHHRIGYNSRFDEVLAAFQLHRLPELTERLDRRARIAGYYTERFAPLREHGVVVPPADRNGRCAHTYALLLQRRDDLRTHLEERGVAAKVFYPVPLPRHPAFAHHASAGRVWPHAEYAGAHNLAVPLWPELTDGQVEQVADSVCDFFA